MTQQRFMHYSSRFAALALLASLSACSSDEGPPTTTKVGTLEGNFTAELIAAVPELGTPAFTKFLGVVYDGHYPDTIQLAVDSEQGGCQLLVPKTPFCSPSCGATGVCTAENKCTLYPKAQDLGDVHLTGLGPTEVVMPSMAPGYNYQPDVTLPNPSCSEGAAVGVKTKDFTIEGKCIAPFNLTTDPVPVHSGQGISLAWTPPGVAGISRAFIHLDIAHHGGKKGEINCDVPDTGSFTVPEPLVTKLVSLGLAGFPTIVVGRKSSAAAATQSEVRLMVSSSIEKAVDTGVVSCSDASMCPAGQMCQADLTCK
jgi:hypothetical protein